MWGILASFLLSIQDKEWNAHFFFKPLEIFILHSGFFHFFKVLLEDNSSAVQQSDSFIRINTSTFFFFRFSSYVDDHRILGRVRCAVQQVPCGPSFRVPQWKAHDNCILFHSHLEGRRIYFDLSGREALKN